MYVDDGYDEPEVYDDDGYDEPEVYDDGYELEVYDDAGYEGYDEPEVYVDDGYDDESEVYVDGISEVVIELVDDCGG